MNGLRGGVLYHDGQFDDARYIVALLRTFQELGGTAINYVEATGLLQRNGKTIGVKARDSEERHDFELQAKVVVNATGVFSEDILAMDGAARGSLLAMSQGTHFVLPHSFLPGGAALMVPKTADGRVLFAIPWHGATVVGTTDEAVDQASVGTAFDSYRREVFCWIILIDTLGAGPGRRRSLACGRDLGRW